MLPQPWRQKDAPLAVEVDVEGAAEEAPPQPSRLLARRPLADEELRLFLVGIGGVYFDAAVLALDEDGAAAEGGAIAGGDGDPSPVVQAVLKCPAKYHVPRLDWWAQGQACHPFPTPSHILPRTPRVSRLFPQFRENHPAFRASFARAIIA